MSVLQAIFVNPFLNILVELHNIIPGHDLGLSIIALTFLVRLLLYPVSAKQIKAQRAMQDLQPRINKIREKHKNDKEAQSKALMEFYKENKINPLSSCGPLVIQMAFIYPLFIVFRMVINGGEIADKLYSFVSAPPFPLEATLLGFLDLSKSHNIILAVLTAGVQFYQSWMLQQQKKKDKPGESPAKPSAKKDTAAAISKNMLYFFPLLTGYIAYTFPAGIALYWLASTSFAVIQQWIIMRTISSQPKEQHEHQGEIEIK